LNQDVNFFKVLRIRFPSKLFPGIAMWSTTSGLIYIYNKRKLNLRWPTAATNPHACTVNLLINCRCRDKVRLRKWSTFFAVAGTFLAPDWKQSKEKKRKEQICFYLTVGNEDIMHSHWPETGELFLRMRSWSSFVIDLTPRLIASAHDSVGSTG